ncbi:MAG: hypothetical protein M1539_02195 [Actinobacteria bacterium]|nr:hypothetical protein [Actinomycetota bacterium]MCL5882779.1 hypothetical protein [Actinomycetota bacterium]
MSDTKKLAVIVRDRQGEALRMSLGLVLADDEVTVYNLGAPIERNDDNNLNIESLEMMDCKLFSVNQADEGFEQINMQQVPLKLLEYDHVIAY